MSVEVREVVAEVHERLDVLAGLDLDALTPDEIAEHTVAMHRLQARVEALTARSVGVFDRRGDLQGARGTAPWLAWQTKIPLARAKAELSRARALRKMPETRAAHEAGAISAEHVRLLAGAYRAAPELFDKREAELVEDAASSKFSEFSQRIRYFHLEADRDGVDERAADAFARRELFASKTFEDTVALNGILDPVGGAIYLHELQRLEQELFDADWRDARRRLGEHATAADLQRTAAQRRHDAQIQMAIRSAAKHPNAKDARVLLSVHVGYETFHGPLCQLADGTVVSPAQVVPWLAGHTGVIPTVLDVDDVDADLEAITFDGPGRVIDVGRRHRLFRNAGRRAVEARDLTCTHPSCDEPYERCDVDHIQRWEHQGPTNQTNGRLRCPVHNPGRRRPHQPPPEDTS